MDKATPMPVLTTARLTLTIPAVTDARAMLRYFEDNREHLAPWDPPYPEGFFTEAFWARQLDWGRREFQAGQSARFVLRLKDDPQGPIIGRCSFSNFVRGVFHSCYLGYSVSQRHQGHGYMTEGLEAAVRFVFDELHMHRIQANYLPINERSGRLLRRLGFQVEGYARDYLFINGAWRDHIMTARINDSMEGLPTPAAK